MLEFDRITQPELELYTLINLYSGQEHIVTMDDMKNSVYSDAEITKMLSCRHNNFMLIPKFNKLDFPDSGIATNFRV